MPQNKIRAKIYSWIGELFESVKFSAEDLTVGKRFWVPVVLAIIPTIVGALQVSSHGSRLAVTLEAGEPQYESIIAADSKPAEYLNTLSGVIQRELAQRVVIPFVGTQASSDALKERDVNKETANRFGLYFAKVKLNVQSQVTNIGSKPSSVKEIVWYLVEDADGNRETLDVVSRVPSTNLKLPESEPVSLAKEGEIVEFSGFGGWRLIEYETVRIIDDSLRRFSTKEKSLFSLADPYLRLLDLHDPVRRERALRIADPSHRSKVILGVEVTDIYGRMAHAEAILRDSAKWNREKP